METLIFPRDEVLTWKIPPFQRPVRINDKVLSVAEQMKIDGGIIPGILTLGRLGTDKTIYIVDGQHRLEAFKIADLPECLVDARMCTYTSMADMAEDFVELNGRLVNMRPDDILRGLEESTPLLRRIRASCDYVTYGQINRSAEKLSHVVGMSLLLRAWNQSRSDVAGGFSVSSTQLAQSLEADEVDRLILFMQVARSAWGDEPENYRLWSGLNLTMCMWLFRRVVLDKQRGGKKAVLLSPEQFRKGLMSVAATAEYSDWLVGRRVGERDRAPCYARLTAIFAKRLQADGLDKVMFPRPAWTTR
jgi:hypothetical protein